MKSAASRATVARPSISSRRTAVSVRAMQEELPTPTPTPTPQQQEPVPVTSTGASVAAPFSLLNATTEAINGRAAMMGFVAAVVAEQVTHQSVFSQMAGVYANQEIVEKAIGVSSLGFAMIATLVTVGTLAPRFLAQQSVDARSFGAFTPGLEKIVGRVAMMGFFGLVIVEAIKGSALLG
eukprot:CAMPEP_0119115776 /NCGR_PEP_ID=MMETSP1180-20130426/51925_1 /TAXON_ID=3052 ORGANISM="Chlamydomonas cf sp, Strain CCMP681" /NCGR_SAMPLE_ID=MMETSP1180 /ASSEMBLY_ACC=CAM_ASM_000741 /LENGTH=179 /DNA_ID=CAMNT_0007104867 /DNA_START=88 /DNA_END=627 /DNA_ORIENTATION=+